MLIYYIFLLCGVLLVIAAIYTFITMYVDNSFSTLIVGGCFGFLAIGGIFLFATLPSLKYMIFKEYVVVSGNCVVKVDSSGSHSEVDIEMLDTKEVFTFRDVPTLDAYGKSFPYFCGVTVTKDHKFEISYKIYDAKTRKLLVTSK
ncbi:hypothetical protein HPK19_19610 [Arthrobacter citreus]|nr:hypothetical protein HPK19_19610 [Arthrobacter citreus]